MDEVAPGHGYHVEPQELKARATAIGAIGESTNDLLASANRLAERLPMLGTAPPALHLALRLREAAGAGGLTGDVGAIDEDLHGFHDALKTTITRYLDRESDTTRTLRTIGGAVE